MILDYIKTDYLILSMMLPFLLCFITLVLPLVLDYPNYTIRLALFNYNF